MLNTASVIHKSERDDWCAVYTRHQHESVVARKLSESDVEAFLPTHYVIRQWKDRKKRMPVPLFPCYVFLRIGIHERLKVLSTAGVIFIVTIAGHPAPIADAEITAIRRVVESEIAVVHHPFLRCGDRVRVKSGPLCDVEGILTRWKGACRLVLSAQVLEKSIAVEVDADDVEHLPLRPSVTESRFPQSQAQMHQSISEMLPSQELL